MSHNDDIIYHYPPVYDEYKDDDWYAWTTDDVNQIRIDDSNLFVASFDGLDKIIHSGCVLLGFLDRTVLSWVLMKTNQVLFDVSDPDHELPFLNLPGQDVTDAYIAFHRSAAWFDSDLKQVKDCRVGSCLTLLCGVNRCFITTAEGLGNNKDGFYFIHQRISGFHASQCGFCTPGMCVSFFSVLVDAVKLHPPEPAPGLSKLSVSEVDISIYGNLYRCTGYPDVCKSFAADVNMEALGLKTFCTKDSNLDKLPIYNSSQICTYPDFLKNKCKCPMVEEYQNRSWHTGTGYYKETKRDKYIDLRFILEFLIIKRRESQVEVGTTVSNSKLIVAFKGKSNNDFCLEGDTLFKKYASQFESIATESFQNSISIGGNLVITQRQNFPSDITTSHIVVISY